MPTHRHEPWSTRTAGADPGAPHAIRRAAEHVLGLVRWFGPRRILTAAGVLIAVGAGGWWLLHGSPPPLEQALPRVTTSSPVRTDGASGERSPRATDTVAPVVPPDPAAAAPVVVHVAGAVVHPGVVRLPGGSRVEDALRAAGGALTTADLDALNLAARCDDGSRVYVPRVGEAVPPAVGVADAGWGSGAGTALRVNINRASAADLDALPGIGPSVAGAIVGFRESHGSFRSPDDLLRVPGIGPAKLAQIRSLVTV